MNTIVKALIVSLLLVGIAHAKSEHIHDHEKENQGEIQSMQG